MRDNEENGQGKEKKREKEKKRRRYQNRREDGGVDNDQEATFGIQILDIRAILGEEVKMKNTPPFVLPKFYGMSFKYPDSFLFEFDIVCCTYGYIDDTHKLHFFPATLKASALKWFTGLGKHTITSWEDTRKIFHKKYQSYCRPRDSKDDVFRMNQQEDESLEEYLEIFLYNLLKSKHRSLDLDIIRIIFLKGIRNEYLDILNVMGK